MREGEKKVVVTGGLGFIGSHFVDLLLGAVPECRVLVFDAHTYCASDNNLRRHISDDRLYLSRASVTDREALERAVKGARAVVHFAAESHVDRSIRSSLPFYETNVMGTLNVLEVCRECKVQRIVVISTDEVYGNCASSAVEKATPFRPRSPYAASKAAADHSASSFFITHGLPVCIVRPVNNYGPRQYPEKLMPKFISGVIHGRKTPIYGTGNNTREWLFVGDTSRAILGLLTHKRYEEEVAGEAFNIGSGLERSALQMLEYAAGKMGVELEEHVEYVDDRPGHVTRHRVNSTKIERATGWRPEVDLADGLDMTIDWYRRILAPGEPEWWSDNEELPE